MNAKQSDTLDNASLHQLAEQAMKRYPANLQGQLSLLCRSENATFKILAFDDKRYALRIHRGDYHSREGIESELAWLDALQQSGIQVPQALSGLDGQQVQTLILNESESRNVVLFHWIDGEMPTTEVDPRAFMQLGEVTGRLHQHSRSWQRPAGFQRILWDNPSMVGQNGHWGRWQDAPRLTTADHPLVEEALQQIDSRLQDYGQDAQRFGLIHADLRLTNLLMHNGETRVIDFDDCGFGWYMHDAAAAISFIEHYPQADQWLQQWLRGYQRVCPISDADLAILPTMIAQRRIQLLAWVGSHATTEMAISLGEHWEAESLRLCRHYLQTADRPLAIL